MRERRPATDHFKGADHQRRPGEQRQPDFFHGGIKGKRGSLVDAIRGLDLEELALGAHEVAGAAVFDLHAFGFARGAGGVDDVAEVLRRGACFRAAQALCGLGGDVGLELVQGEDLANGR